MEESEGQVYFVNLISGEYNQEIHLTKLLLYNCFDVILHLTLIHLMIEDFIVYLFVRRKYIFLMESNINKKLDLVKLKFA